MEPTNAQPPMQQTGAQKPTTATPAAPTLIADAKGLATKVAGQAQDAVTHQVTDKQEQSAGEISKVAQALHQTSEGLADSVAAPYVEKAAAMLDRLSGSVRDASLRDVMRSTENLARRDPAMFLGGAFVLGLLAARFLKSTAHPDDADADAQHPAGTGPRPRSRMNQAPGGRGRNGRY